jgi:membrane protein DedA with SNARE-associated domain
VGDAVAVADATGATLVAVPEVPRVRRWASPVGLVIGLLVLGGPSAASVPFPIYWQAIDSWGCPGVFGAVFVATASVALPVPDLLIVARAGSYFDPLLIAIVAGVAGMLDEMTSYLVGVGGSALIPHGRWYERARGWIGTYGVWCIALFACVPNPLFDAIGILAGTLRYSWWRFTPACVLGTSITSCIAAWTGVEIAQHSWTH